MGADEAAWAGARRLFEEVFGHPVSAVHWAWKYGAAADARCLNLVAIGPEGPSRPWGHVGCRVMPAHWRGQMVWGAHLTDVMVHPQARGGLGPQTLYARLMRAMATELMRLPQPLLAWGFPGLTPSRLGARMGLYRPLQRVTVHTVKFERPNPSWALPFRTSSLFGRCKVVEQAWDEQTLRALDTLWSRHTAHRAPRGDVAFAPGTATHPACNSAPVVVRNAAYMAWRYREHPGKPYRLWRVQGPWWHPLGWLVSRQDPQPLVVDQLLPAQWSSGERWGDVLRALAHASGERQWSTWNAPNPDGEAAQSALSLIVPVEFRAAELAGAGTSIWTKAVAATPSAHPVAFQPGDTDVF
jgi:hypothetical protein